MIFKRKVFKNVLLTIAFYSIAALVIYLLDKQSPSGPCTPGLGALAFILTIAISAILLFLNVYKTIYKDIANFSSILVHLIAWTIFLLR